MRVLPDFSCLLNPPESPNLRWFRIRDIVLLQLRSHCEEECWKDETLDCMFARSRTLQTKSNFLVFQNLADPWL